MSDADDTIPSTVELYRRVRALEAAETRRLRRDRRALGVAGLVLALAATVGASALVPDTLAARSFRLVDASGGERAALVVSDGGAVALDLLDTKGASAAKLVLAGTEPLLSVIDAEGRRYAASPVAAVVPPAAAKAPAPVASPNVPSAGEPPAKAEPAERGPIGWSGAQPADEDDDSFDWAD